jgi:peptide/nickel transport system ATP-binding protein
LHLVVPDPGELIFDGDPVNTRELPVDALRRQVQIVFQDSYSSLNPRMPVRDSVAFGPFVQGKKKQQARDIACEMLGKVGLDPDLFGPRYPHELSGGQKQRVNMLAHSPLSRAWSSSTSRSRHSTNQSKRRC